MEKGKDMNIDFCRTQYVNPLIPVTVFYVT